MSTVLKFLAEGDVAMWAIVLTGLFGIAVVAERAKTLYFDFTIPYAQFMEKLRGLVMSDKIEEAVALCASYPKAPLAQVAKSVLERADQDDGSIDQGLDVKYAEVMPKFHKGFGYMAMIANVATLLGLLGTVHGLIMAFEAVSFADPAQKQMMLAQSISIALVATMSGLFVAIPMMFIYSFFHARQNHLVEEVIAGSAAVVDLLKHRNYEPFKEEKVYAMNNKGLPPTPARKMA
ncbi:MAG TPA: MotA/TolQ/ExbB proton channel family protein [Bdellovibrionales bacterium]|nr:MotA/TolQ/ExbB proton channel family protein [Bdellovibrionales bacterium]